MTCFQDKDRTCAPQLENSPQLPLLENKPKINFKKYFKNKYQDIKIELSEQWADLKFGG